MVAFAVEKTAAVAPSSTVAIANNSTAVVVEVPGRTAMYTAGVKQAGTALERIEAVCSIAKGPVLAVAG